MCRFGHSLLPSDIERWSKTHRYIGSQKLSGMLLQPYDLYKEGWADTYVHGMVNQVRDNGQGKINFFFMSQHLAKKKNKPFG